ncbi:serine hydrolase domain-containing protein [Alkalihalobacillus trypoxylicola]|uniref:Beta-lactamase-related domain-containing protein n=1 Tax=Alkalihalobacillus trypoxylicola TaxID=519424 RepID=A0A161Q6I3_9BACI|nr:serine hydrolase domain-containing protein [Alkalihalobacillus trypoxylicola]KYG31948.1 hypothetical protein AZF04_04015 [Alkalihalobacillus trypoxylicola]
MENLLEHYNSKGYLNGSILIASNDKTLINQGFGYANLEHKILNKPTTKFRIGSLSKAFTAYAIFQLHAKKYININHKISHYLVDYPNGELITIYHCLTNSTGISNYTSQPNFWITDMRLSLSLSELINKFKDLPLKFKPGTKFEYSNSNYAILTFIIEKVSGMSYEDYMMKNVFLPLGLYNTGCDNGSRVIKDSASGYSIWEDIIQAEYTDMSFPLGAYGLYSTTEDLYIWDKALRNIDFLSEELKYKMFKPNHGNYSCGWMNSNILNRSCLHHFGDISGFTSSFHRFINEQITVIFLSNLNITPVSNITKELLKHICEEDPEPIVSWREIMINNRLDFEGHYKMTSNNFKMNMEISKKNNSLFLTVPKLYGALYKYRLIPIEEDLKSITFKTEFVNETLTVYFNGTTIDLIKYTDCYSITYSGLKIDQINVKNN